jgi:hypothetical protein
MQLDSKDALNFSENNGKFVILVSDIPLVEFVEKVWVIPAMEALTGTGL